MEKGKILIKKKNIKRPQNLKNVVAGQGKILYSIIKFRDIWKIKYTLYSNNDIKLQRIKWVDYATYEEAKNALELIRIAHWQ